MCVVCCVCVGPRFMCVRWSFYLLVCGSVCLCVLACVCLYVCFFCVVCVCINKNIDKYPTHAFPVCCVSSPQCYFVHRLCFCVSYLFMSFLCVCVCVCVRMFAQLCPHSQAVFLFSFFIMSLLTSLFLTVTYRTPTTYTHAFSQPHTHNDTCTISTTPTYMHALCTASR
jgi:hypothetical protein